MPASIVSTSVHQVVETSSMPWRSSNLTAQDTGGPHMRSIVHCTHFIRTYNNNCSKKIREWWDLLLLARRYYVSTNVKARVARVSRQRVFSHFAMVETTDLADLNALQAHWCFTAILDDQKLPQCVPHPPIAAETCPNSAWPHTYISTSGNY